MNKFWRVYVTFIAALALLVWATGSAKAAPLQASDDQAACVQGHADLAQLQADHSSVMRVILTPANAGESIPCVQQARAAGYKIYLTFGYGTTWTPQQVAAWISQWLPQYGPVWAVGVGNEVTLQAYRETPAEYRAVWDYVEPTLPADALHVYAEASPWDEGWLKQSWAINGPPRGVNAIAEHAYDCPGGYGLLAVPELAAWAASEHVSLWLSEMTPALDPAALVAAVMAFSPNVGLVDDYAWNITFGKWWPGWAGEPPTPTQLAATIASVKANPLRKAVKAQATRKTVRHRKHHKHRRHHRRHRRSARKVAKLTYRKPVRRLRRR